MKILFISSCTNSKKYKTNNDVTIMDLVDKEKMLKKEKILEKYKCTANEMYKGKQHIYLKEGINLLKDNFEEVDINLYIVSAGYGLINEQDIILPYDITFNDMKSTMFNKWSKYLNVTKKLNAIINKYDLVFILLGEKYLNTIDLNKLKINNKQKVFVFNNKYNKTIVKDKNFYFVNLDMNFIKKAKCCQIYAKGYFIKIIANKSIENKRNILQDIYKEPITISKIIQDIKKG